MKQHGGAKLWPSELFTFFTMLKKALLGFYGRLMRIKVFGEEVWRELRRGCIVVANHVTGADSMILQIALRRRLFMLAAKQWFHGKFVNFFMTFFCDMVPVDKGGVCNLGGIKRALALLRHRQSLALFPSGKMNVNDRMQTIHNGAAYLAVKSGAPIVPVHLKNLALGPQGRSDVMEGLGSVAHNVFNNRIEVYIADPIYPRAGVDRTDRREEINRINAKIRRSYSELLAQASRN